MTADGGNLPGEALVRLHTFEARQQAIDQARDDIRTQRQTGAVLTVVLAFDPGPLQKGSVGQDVR
jgi:hypothetical protein